MLLDDGRLGFAQLLAGALAAALICGLVAGPYLTVCAARLLPADALRSAN